MTVTLCLAGCSNKNYYPWETPVPTPKYQEEKPAKTKSTKTKTSKKPAETINRVKNTKSGVKMMFTLEGNPYASGLWENTLYGVMAIKYDGPSSFNKPEVDLFTSYDKCLDFFENGRK